MSELLWNGGKWKPYGKDLETALQSQEARSCTMLWLHENQLTFIPDSIGHLTNLTSLSLYTNELTSLSDCIWSLTNLTSLAMGHNQLTLIPDSIGQLTNLTTLYLYDNQLKSLPLSMGNLKKLETLTLEENSALPKQYHRNVYCNHIAAQELISDISVYYRNEKMRDAARRAALFIISRYGEGDLAVFPRDLIRLIAKEVWKTRTDPIWMGEDD